MRRLAATLPIEVAQVEAVGWNGDFLEAQCFAYLTVRTLRGLPITLPTVFPKVISSLRKPIAIQAAISCNINLPE